MTGEFKKLNFLRLSSLREGFFSRRSNLTTIASSERFKIASYLAMTIFLFGLSTIVHRRIFYNNYNQKLTIGRVFDSAQTDKQLNLALETSDKLPEIER
jgi:hypothetical protein